MQVAILQYDAAWEDKSANHLRIEGMLRDADPGPGALVLLPELCDTGLSMNLDRIAGDGGRSVAWARGLAREHGWTIQLGHAEVDPEGMGRNCATIVTPGGEAFTYQKLHPMTMLGESRAYRPGRHLLVATLGSLTVAPLICYDLRFPEVFRLASVAGAGLFTVGACWPVERIEHWRALLVARALEGQAFVLGANRTGTDPSLTYGGTSMIISPRGEVLAEAGRTEECVLQATLDVADQLRFREQFPFLGDVRKELLGSVDVVRARSTTTDEAGGSPPQN
ncbi:MAG: nitrilase-related carbon-nitrogen hydrolase [Planctomycetota bacterium]|nr:nitrilase-related carbon-nitrogen hydrolase [Planctomycetota bacterium]MEC9158588.1 nitrilase-related carbon-nitrogen hydrolase [Planctomycetota bacterium]MEC9232654.1 nitrilase-related carbon-nitrogen hydrolase [Planctomycetota bacterium]MED5506847.1 nitrilase-related carbon-nitrogen hydrolase [Planctomycetota bacterium]